MSSRRYAKSEVVTASMNDPGNILFHLQEYVHIHCYRLTSVSLWHLLCRYVFVCRYYKPQVGSTSSWTGERS